MRKISYFAKEVVFATKEIKKTGVKEQTHKSFPFSRLGMIILLFFGVSHGLLAQDRLNGETGTASLVESGINDLFSNLTSATIDVTGVNMVMVVASFDARYSDKVANARDAVFQLTDGITTSPLVRRKLKKSKATDKGMGTLVYMFDASGMTGNVTYTLQHASSTNRAVTSSATIAAIALTTSESHVDLSHDLKSITAPVPSSGVANEWTAVAGLSTDGITLPFNGSIYVAASVGSRGDKDSRLEGVGEWKLQYSPDNSSWSDMGTSTSRYIANAADIGISSLAWVLKDLAAGTYYFRLAHRQTSANLTLIKTFNSNLVATALVYEDAPGYFREFPSFVQKSQLVSTSGTTMTPAISFSTNPTHVSDILLHAQYEISGSDESDSPAYDINVSNGIMDGIDQQSYLYSSTDLGNGANVGLGKQMQAGTNYTVSLRHQSTSGVTLNTNNIVFCGFQLTSIGNSIWTGAGASPTTWGNSDNWSGEAPGSRENAIIPSGAVNYPVLISSISCEDLSIDAGASLALDPEASLTVYGRVINDGLVSVSSSASSTGSLIVYGTATGEVNYNSFFTADQWHIVSPPVSGQSINGFMLNAANQIPENTTFNFYGLTDYDESTNSWNNYFTASTGGDFISGNGYLMRRELADGTVSYTGSLVASPYLVSTSATADGWNAVGNPFVSSIGVSSDASTTENFLDANIAQLDPNYGVLYLWDEQAGYDGTQNNYKVIGNSGYIDSMNYPELDLDYLQAGQGFLVKSITGGGSLVFSNEMQVHQNNVGALKSTGKSWDGFKLVLSSNEKRESSSICFYEGMTLGLDPSCDAGLLSSKPDFSIYTNLIQEDAGVKFKIQCLPDQFRPEVVIPVGVDLPEGGEVSLFSEGVQIPDHYTILLEDRMLDSLIDITSEAEVYHTILPEGTVGSGRFFLHIKDSSTALTGKDPQKEEDLAAFCYNKILTIRGMVSTGSMALLFDIQGRQFGNYELSSAFRNDIPVTTLKEGIYLLMVIDGNKKRTFKVFVN